MTTIVSKEFNDLEAGIAAGFVKTFPDKKSALLRASEFGWGGRALRISRRFETVWIVGEISFQPDEVGPLVWDVLHIPALRYDGAKQPVLKCRRLRKVAA